MKYTIFSSLLIILICGILLQVSSWRRDELEDEGYDDDPEDSDSYSTRNWGRQEDEEVLPSRDNREEYDRITKLAVKMPGVAPKVAEKYLCKAVRLPDEPQFIVKFSVDASMNTAHHLLLFGCSEPGDKAAVWDCGAKPECGERQQILYAWAKNAPALKLPDGVAFEIGPEVNVRYIVMQIHYARALSDSEKDSSGVILHLTKTRQPFAAGILLFASGSAVIPPHAKGYHADMSCRYSKRKDLVPFAFRTHTHSLGRAVSAYVIRDRKWRLIGIGNPQLPQAFYPIPEDKRPVIKYHDHLVARCTFDSNRDTPTYIGSTSKDEMCNFYMMYYTRHRTPPSGLLCSDGKPPKGMHFPKGSDVLPPNLRTHGKMHIHMPGQSGSDENHVHHSAVENSRGSAHHGKKWKTTKDSTKSRGHGTKHLKNQEERERNRVGQIYEERTNAIGNTDFETDLDYLVSTSDRTKMGSPRSDLIVDGDWPYERDDFADLGQVSAIGVNSDGDVVIFHRGPRRWDANSFDSRYRLRRDIDPLKVPTVYHLDPKSGKVIQKWGQELFYMPHGLTIDNHDNIWLTDVGAHQVFKFTPPDFEQPALTVGRALIPGRGRHHFCQPADVAVEKSGVFYVADGYCNSRVMKFTKEGKLIRYWGKGNRDGLVPSRTPGEFSVPHSLALDEARKLIYVADRENGRIQCFNTQGKFYREIYKKEFGRLFAVTFNPVNEGILYAVTTPREQGKTPAGYTLNPKTGVVIGKWSPISTGFSQPHDVCHSPRDGCVYVSEIGPNRIWKFMKRTANTNGKTTEDKEHLGAHYGILVPGKPSKSTPRPLNSSDVSDIGVNIISPEQDPSIIPAVVVVVVLSTPICLICFAAVIQHMRLKHKRQKAVRRRNEASLVRNQGCMACCYTPKYYYDSKRGFDKLIGELSESEDDIFAKGAT